MLPIKKGILGDHLQAGLWGGCVAGIMFGFGESVYLLIEAGNFLADGKLFLKALLVNGLSGAILGFLYALIFYFPSQRLSRRREKVIPFYLSSFFGLGLFTEVFIYLMDIYPYGGNNKGSLKTISLVGLTALVSLILGGSLYFLFRDALARKSTGLSSPRLNLTKAQLTAALIFILGLSFLGIERLSMAKEARLVRSKKTRFETTPPNLILVVIDSLRADHLSGRGYSLPTTPGLDQLAAAGVSFQSAAASSTWTLPTHASLFTGLYPSSHGAYSLFSTLGEEIPTLAEILSRNGYYSLSLYNNPLLGKTTGLDRGFDRALGIEYYHKTALTLERLFRKYIQKRSPSEEMVQIARRWIDHCSKQNVPYFIFFNFFDVHFPYIPKEPYFREFLKDTPLDRVNWPLVNRVSTSAKSKKELFKLLAELTEPDLAVLAKLYDSNIRFIDQQIERFTGALRKSGQLQKGLLVITSDHGEFLGEHHELGHVRDQLYSPVLRIPLIFYFPRMLAARTENRYVSQVDIFPSILALCGLADQIPKGIQGVNLFSSTTSRTVLSEFWDDQTKRFTRAIFSEGKKLICVEDSPIELYNLADDLQEKRNLASLQTGEANRLAGELRLFLSSMQRFYTGSEERKKKEMVSLLKSLGYLD
jgi:arylsulfatase A-like enzyme